MYVAFELDELLAILLADDAAEAASERAAEPEPDPPAPEHGADSFRLRFDDWREER